MKKITILLLLSLASVSAFGSSENECIKSVALACQNPNLPAYVKQVWIDSALGYCEGVENDQALCMQAVGIASQNKNLYYVFIEPLMQTAKEYCVDVTG